MNLEELKANIVKDCFTLEQIFKLLNEILERK